MSQDDAELSPQQEWLFYLGFLLTLGLVFLVIGIFEPIVPYPLMGQVLTWIWIIFAAAKFPMLRPFLRQAPTPHLCILVTLLMLVVCGHFTLQPRAYFPIMSWAIFPGPNDKVAVSCKEMIGIRADKSEVRLLVEQIFPSIIQFNLPEDGASGLLSPQMGPVIQAVAQEYNVLHPNAPVVTVELREITVILRPSSPEDKPTWKLLNSYPISGRSSS